MRFPRMWLMVSWVLMMSVGGACTDLWAQTIVQGEYFFDKDPGVGLGNPLPFTPGATVEIATEIPTTGLLAGAHNLFVRFKDSEGKWGLAEERLLFVYVDEQSQSVPAITQGEYFYDKDPGVGLGTKLQLTPGQTVNLATDIPTTGLTVGPHNLFVRFKDSEGKWGLAEERLLFVYVDEQSQNAATLTYAEYFFDNTNPPLGKATRLNFTHASAVELLEKIDIKGLSEGDHRLTLRVQDDQGRWGAPEIQEFTVATPRLDTITPASGGNIGNVTVSILGASFDEGTSVKLTRSGLLDIMVPDSMQTIINGEQIQATLDLKDKAEGLYNVVVTLANGTKLTLPNSFSVVKGIEAAPWAEVMGFDRIRRGQWQTYTINYGNKGNVDAIGVPLNIVIGKDTTAEVKLDFELDQSYGQGFPYDSIPVFFNADSLLNERYLAKIYPLLISTIPANSVNTISIQIKANNDIELLAYTDAPYYNEQTLKVVYPDSPTSGERVIDLPVFVGGGPAGGRIAAGGNYEMNSYQEDCYAYIITKLPYLITKGYPIPGLNCVNAVLDLFVEGELVKYKHKSNGARLASFMWQFGKSSLDCALDVVPAGRLARMAREVYVFARHLEDAQPCGEAFNQMISPLRKYIKKVRVVNSFDPNDKLGSTGTGPRNFVYGDAPFRYLIRFENKASATAAAQTVLIVDTLDKANLDLSSLELGFMSFNDRIVNVPPGRKNYTAYVDLRPSQDLTVKIEAKLDEQTGVLTWLYTSLDPSTRKLTLDPDAGFLPPNKTAPEGEGGVFFTIRPKSNLVTDEDIKNRAYIYFDNNEVIPTPIWSNSIDKLPPVSQVASLPQALADSTFTVSWSGSDAGAGIRNYSVYVSVNDKPYKLWLNKSTGSSYLFKGKPDSTYRFYSIAQDSTGILEAAPATADATTTIAKVTGLEEELARQVKVYPNPVVHTLKVELPLALRNVTVTLINARGVVVSNLQANNAVELSLIVSRFGKGLHLLRISNDKSTVVKKIIIE